MDCFANADQDAQLAYVNGRVVSAAHVTSAFIASRAVNAVKLACVVNVANVVIMDVVRPVHVGNVAKVAFDANVVGNFLKHVVFVAKINHFYAYIILKD